MSIEELYELQKELDRVIVDNWCARKKRFAEQSDFLNERLLALHGEVSELADSTRGFKYWSTKPSEPKERVLDELADVIHFTFSVANSLGFSCQEIEKAYLEKHQVNYDRQKSGY